MEILSRYGELFHPGMVLTKLWSDQNFSGGTWLRKIDILRFFIVVSVLLGLVSILACNNSDEIEFVTDPFAHLDSFRDREKQAIEKHFRGLKQAADSIGEDELMQEFFLRLLARNDQEASGNGLGPAEVQILDSHFVQQFGSFYDALFIESGGYVFHSIKHESDHHSNLFLGSLSKSSLAQELRKNSQVEFVDFEPYGPSGESAAFFVSPVVFQGKNIGWFVLQYGSNELNAMLSNQEHFGRTGEIYLVNQNRMMLSDSRFINKSSVLLQTVDTEPVRQAFAMGTGHLTALDYRGVEVYSSFDTLSIMGPTWAILMEIDADEIQSNFYLADSSNLNDQISTKTAADGFSHGLTENELFELASEDRVDINELRRASGGSIWTAGVGPCTALVVFYPKTFGYMLHVGPTDDAYNESPFTRIFLGTRRTDLVSDLMQRVTRFDIVGNDISKLRFVVVASHINSIEGILSTLLDRGVMLSQIKFVHDPASDYANVQYNQENDEVLVNWVKLSPEPSVWSVKSSQLTNIGGLLERIPAN